MKTTYDCKVYQNNDYLGLLRPVAVPPSYSQDINSAGAQVQIKLGAALDDAGPGFDRDILITKLVTTTPTYLITDTGARIMIDSKISFSTIPIDLANRVIIIKYHDGAPNGEVEFDGVITSWNAGYQSNSMTITAINWGIRLDQYMIESVAGTAAIEYHTNTGEITQNAFTVPIPADLFFRQTFTLVSPTEISTVRLFMRVDSSLQYVVEIPNPAGGIDLGYLQRTVSNTTQEWVDFTFPSPAVLAAGTYSFDCFINAGAGHNAWLAHDSAGGYSGGSLYIQSSSPGDYINQNKDLVFELITATGGGAIGGNFLSEDPSNMLRTIIDSAHERGSPITYDSSSIDDTDTVVSYNFKFNTALDGVSKIVNLAPSGWYWYIDMGTNLVHLHRQGRTADHTFWLTQHIDDLQLEYTLDDVRNQVYFSGGDTGGGSNLLRAGSNVDSQAKYGVWLDRPSDPRVTLTDTADILIDGTLQQNAKPVFRTVLIIPASKYDIESIHLGQMVSFGGFASGFINTLLLQIVGVDKGPENIVLHLNTLPPRQSQRVEDIKRNLDATQTINNPSQTT